MPTRTIKNRLAAPLLSCLPVALLKRIGNVNPLVTYYHIVTDGDVPHVKHLYPLRSVGEFENDIDAFLALYTPITLQRLIETLSGGPPLAPNSFLLTFDDGFREIYDVVAPLLLRKGVPATFFLNTAFLDNRGMAHHNKLSLLIDHLTRFPTRIPQRPILESLRQTGIEGPSIETALLSIKHADAPLVAHISAILGVDFHSYLATARPYVTSEEVSDLIRKGFTIGAHSVDHPPYSALSLDDQLYQTQASVRFLRNRFLLSYGAFAFPHGDRNVPGQFFREMFASADVDISFGTGGVMTGTYPGHFQRLSMEYDFAAVNRVLRSHYARNFVKRLLRALNYA
jgi:peptidoglycan/xylan/chitin deacetylase (PgdA/CDA1 family)